MSRRALPLLFLLQAAIPVAARAQEGHTHDPSHQHGRPATDSAFAEVQARGKVAMGVDQYTSTHRFDALPDGGRIELQRDPADTAGVRTIRAHLQEIAQAFTAGNFNTPGFVHATEVPGVRVMTRKRAAIRYAFRPLPGGGEVRIVTIDPEAVKAVHDFLAFQRSDHRVPE
ncbi:MAG TPA: hypothetical protein VK012_03370 [Gemmatimonadales bacterium]|nr:hypothetical protein [Gemmatimonadales bacterium]